MPKERINAALPDLRPHLRQLLRAANRDCGECRRSATCLAAALLCPITACGWLCAARQPLPDLSAPSTARNISWPSHRTSAAPSATRRSSSSGAHREETGCTILGKAEFMNPGQSVKDRAALFIIRDALAKGPAAARRHHRRRHRRQHRHRPDRHWRAHLASRCVIVIPETQSQEKKDTLRLLGAELVEVPAKPYRNPNNYVKYSARLAEQPRRPSAPGGAIWANQFDNVANRQAHIETTAPETLGADRAARSTALPAPSAPAARWPASRWASKPRAQDIQIALADPPGAALYSYYTHGELKAEGSSITEGIGQGRITANLEGADSRPRLPDPGRPRLSQSSSSSSRKKASASAHPRASMSLAPSSSPRPWDPATPS